jgi:hypothetical protein
MPNLALKRNTNAFPPTRAAWLITISGLLALLIAIAFHAQLFGGAFGLIPVSPGGAETIVAFYIGLPALILSALLLGIASAVPGFRSKLSLSCFAIASLGLFIWATMLAFT